METNASITTTQPSFFKKNKKTIIVVVVIIVLLIILYFYIKNKNEKKEEHNFNQDTKEEKKPEVKGLVGKQVFPKKDEKFVDIRGSAEIADNNIIGKVQYPNEIGRILNVRMNKEDGKLWYRVRFPEKIGGKNEGFVREDFIIIKEK